MAETETIKIEKFQNAAQWTAWRFTVRVTLIAADIFDIVNGDKRKPAPAGADFTAEQTSARLKSISIWMKSDARAQRIIVTSLGEKTMLHILHCETAKAMWDKLHSVYEQRDECGKQLLQQQFFSFAKSDEDDMATHISKLETLVFKLRQLGMAIDEEMVITRLLTSLPVEYNHFSSAWDSTAAISQTLGNLTSRLIAEEGRIQKFSDEASEAFFVRKSRASKSNKNDERREESSTEKKGKCFGCGKKGHYKRDCKEPKGKSADDSKTKSSQNKAKNNESSSKQFFTGVMNASPSDVWFVDSGATEHVCKHRSWFSKYTVLNTKREVILANGSKTYGVGRGEIEVLAFDGADWNKKTLTNVLHVPHSFANLFAPTKAMDHGHTMRSNNEIFELLDGNDVVAVGKRRGGLFEMQFKVIEQTSMANVAMKTNTLKNWHELLGHQNVVHVKDFLKARGIDYIEGDFNCDGCAYGKMHRLSFGLREEKSSECGQIIHADLWGPCSTKSLAGSAYFVVFKDDYSHMRFIYFLKQKSDVFENFKALINFAEKHCGHGIKILQTDNGTEFVNENMKKYMDGNGIRHRRSVPYTPEQNGSVEREMRTIVEAARSMLHMKDIKYALWAEAMNTAVYILNRTGTSTVKGKTPYELWYDKQASIEHFHVFGTEVYVHIPKQKRHKLDAKAKKCLFVGYDENVKGFRVYDPASNKVEFARDVKFLTEAVDGVGIVTENTNEDDSDETACADQPAENVERLPPVRIQRRRNSMDQLDVRNIIGSRLRSRTAFDAASMILLAANEPTTFKEAMESQDQKQWEQAMHEEIASLQKNETWLLVDHQVGQKIIDNKWVFKIKENPDGSVDRYKARLVVRGFSQQQGIDYEETFSPVARYGSIRTVLALAAARKLKIKQFDIKTAFLYGELNEDVFMKQPTGFDDGSNKVCKLRKSLYGLKQASRCWNRKFTSFTEEFGFTASQSDPCVFIKTNGTDIIMLVIYVDDGMIVGNNLADIDKVIAHMEKHFEVKMVNAGCFLGIEIDQLDDGSIFIHQNGYAKRVLERFNMKDCNAVAIPGDPNQKMSKFADEPDAEFPYRQAIGSLMYLATCTRPDICHAIGVASRFMEHPKEVHVNAVKRILKYVKGTPDYGILYESENSIQLNGFSDSDYAGNIDTRKSTTGYVFLFNTGIISWCSKSQKCVTLSTTEAEYVAGAEATKEMVWLKRLLSELLPNQDIETTLYMDNQAAIRLVKNPEFHKRTKHIDVDYHYIREKYNEGRFSLEYIASERQLADGLTKPLPKERFEFLREKLNVLPKSV